MRGSTPKSFYEEWLQQTHTEDGTLPPADDALHQVELSPADGNDPSPVCDCRERAVSWKTMPLKIYLLYHANYALMLQEQETLEQRSYDLFWGFIHALKINLKDVLQSTLLYIRRRKRKRAVCNHNKSLHGQQHPNKL